MIGIESQELLADIRRALAARLESEANYRDRCAEEYPEDLRNERAADELRKLAGELEFSDVYDDTPALRKLLKVVTCHDLDPDDVASMTGPEFDASLFRFHDATENEDAFLERYADAVEAGFEEVES
ncbi:Uncharacterised protein [Mycobacteroides abscessus subsp. abscessus]|nr:Uncharacterised protein [Mycobacteroides abscessus subsp. abscessus]